MSIPTLAIFKDGQLVSRIVGYAPKAELQQHIEATLNARAVGAAAGRK
jgi:thioredoxin-like negative regulator of GroEL